MNIQVKLFGAFRDWSSSGSVRLELPTEANVADVRRVLGEQLQQLRPHVDSNALLSDSVFADDESTLLETDPIRPGQDLAILPPVCGG